MEDHTVVKKRSVAELAGKFSCQIHHMTDAEVNKPVRRRPPRTLQIPAANDAGQDQDEKGAGQISPRKKRNSALIEKLQANLTLSPTGPPPFPKSPGVVKLPVSLPFSSGSPGSPSSPPVIITPKQEENPTSFEKPAEGGVLKSFNKGRARLSIRRRPPSRKHRKSSAEEGGEEEMNTREHATPNGHEGDVFDCVDITSISSEQQIEQETKSTDAEKQHTEDAEPETTVDTVTVEKKDEGEEEEKAEKEVKEEKIGDELQLAESTSESKEQEEAREEPVTQTHEKPQSEPDTTTDENDTEQKEEVEINQ